MRVLLLLLLCSTTENTVKRDFVISGKVDDINIWTLNNIDKIYETCGFTIIGRDKTKVILDIADNKFLVIESFSWNDYKTTMIKSTHPDLKKYIYRMTMRENKVSLEVVIDFESIDLTDIVENVLRDIEKLFLLEFPTNGKANTKEAKESK